MKTTIVFSAAILLACLAESAIASEISLESAPPVVVRTIPVAGSTNVDPALREIRVTYSKAMQDESWSWSTWGVENFPETTGAPHYLADGRTCVLPVTLQPGKFYALWLNSDKFKNFKDANGRPALPYLLAFYTGEATPARPGESESIKDSGPKAETPSQPPQSGAPAVPVSTAWETLLNTDQRSVLAWTDRQFRSFFDGRTFDGWSEKERAGLERRLIDSLKGPRTREYYQAINTLAALRSTNALPALRELAFDRRDKDNRDRWMSVRALGLLDDKSSVPEMIHLVYHGNANTRWWAQISLVRLTGQNFAGDWKAWGKWWNEGGGQPLFKPEIIRWWSGQAEPDKLEESLAESDRKFLENLRVNLPTKLPPAEVGKPDVRQTASQTGAAPALPIKKEKETRWEWASTNQPTVVAVSPTNGAAGVDATQDLRIRFDRPMNPFHLELIWLSGGFYPNGHPRYEPDKNDFVIPVLFTPGQEQDLLLNPSRDKERWEASGKPAADLKRRSIVRREGFLGADSAVANEFRWSFSTKSPALKLGAIKPNVVRISPPSGATPPVLALVEIAFDQPMMLPNRRFPYLTKQSVFPLWPAIIPWFDYEAASHCITIPVVLAPNQDTRLTLEGFSSADGVSSDPVELHYQIGNEDFSAQHKERTAAAAQDPRLEALLAAMQKARAQLNSGVETVQSISLSVSKVAFNQIKAWPATFKWQGSNQVYADITAPMGLKAFILGSDGKTCWLYSEYLEEAEKKRLESWPAVEVMEKRLALADPFGLSDRSVLDAVRELSLVYEGTAQLDGRQCHRVRKWDVLRRRNNDLAFAALIEWWIDAETLLPAQVVQYHPNRCFVFRFHYDQLNQSIPDTAFQPPVGPSDKTESLFKKEPGRPFIQISDGSNGRTAVWLGVERPDGRRVKSGMN